MNAVVDKLVNPFRYLSLRKALCWGIVALILTSIFAWQYGLRLTSLTQVDFGGSALWRATLRQLLAWMTFAVVLYAAGVAASKSKIRFWDVASFNLFARIPFDLTLLVFAVPSVKSVFGYAIDGNINAMLTHTTLLTIVGIVALLLCVWYFYWTYKAFAESTNVKNGRGVVIFIVAYIVAQTAVAYLFRFI